jgi:hypothetical protein
VTALTYGMVSFVDAEIGRVLGELDRLGLREETVVVFMSDHGDMLGDHWMLNKGPFHLDGLIRIPDARPAPDRAPADVARRDRPHRRRGPASPLPRLTRHCAGTAGAPRSRGSHQASNRGRA